MKTGQIFGLAARVASVTGGSVEWGRQMAEGLAGMGAHLVLCARKKERCLETASVAAMTSKWRLSFLPSDASDIVTGHILAVDGGQFARRPAVTHL
jgi:short-subunit dehydrogenase